MNEGVKITILIPAHNEEAMVSQCISSCLNQTVPADQIVVVNDGSTDRTKQILESFGEQITILNIPKATGNKSKAQALGLQLVTGDVVISTDADTILHECFVSAMKKKFADPNIAAASGYIKSMRYNFLTALREVEYVVGQDLYKNAQAALNFLVVIPGAASAFRTELFRNGVITFDHDTLTEDLDFTYKLHRKGYQVAFVQEAVVFTQDPPNLHSYINQTRRWYFGGWQNLFKHKSIFFVPKASLLLSVNYVDGMFSSFLFLMLPLINFKLFLVVFGLNSLVLLGVGLYAAIVRRRIELLFYSPARVVLQFLHSYLFIEQFFKALFFGHKNMSWFKPERRVIIADSI